MQPVNASEHPEFQIDENFETLSWASVYGNDPTNTDLGILKWGYYGGIWGGFTVADGFLTLTDNATNYIVVALVDGAISVTTTSTNWDDTGQYRRVYKITLVSGAITVFEDHRGGPAGIHAGIAKPEPIVWRVVTDADATLQLSDAENAVAISSASAHNLTVPPNSSVPFPVGTSILISQDGTGQITLVEGSGVTIRVNSALTKKLSTQWSVASVVKRGTDLWQLSGDLEAV